jgi:hypothetical protein
MSRSIRGGDAGAVMEGFRDRGARADVPESDQVRQDLICVCQEIKCRDQHDLTRIEIAIA